MSETLAGQVVREFFSAGVVSRCKCLRTVHSALVDGEGQSWNVRFHRGFNDLELELVHSILYLLSTNSPRRCDKMRGGLNGSNRVAVCSFYEAIQDTQVTSFPWNSIWYVKAPKQVSLSVWIVAWGKIFVIIS